MFSKSLLGFDISFCKDEKNGESQCSLFHQFHDIVYFSESNQEAGFKVVRLHEASSPPKVHIVFGPRQGKNYQFSICTLWVICQIFSHL